VCAQNNDFCFFHNFFLFHSVDLFSVAPLSLARWLSFSPCFFLRAELGEWRKMEQEEQQEEEDGAEEKVLIALIRIPRLLSLSRPAAAAGWR
jgi:hypothetical protein